MNSFKRAFRVGVIPRTYPVGNGGDSVYVQVEYIATSDSATKAHAGCDRLSISGVVGDANGSCGQILADLANVTTYANGWTAELARELAEIWQRWHLNDAFSGCAHQRKGGEHAAEFDTSHLLDLTPLTWGPRYNEQRRKAESGQLSTDEYTSYAAMVPKVYALTIAMDRPKHPALWGEDGARLLAEGWVMPGKTAGDGGYDRAKAGAGSVKPSEHPDGVLCRPCPTCGYKWGSAWLHEPVPVAVLERLLAMPESDRELLPVWRR